MEDLETQLRQQMKLDARMQHHNSGHSVVEPDQADRVERRRAPRNEYLIEPVRCLCKEGASNAEIASALKISAARVAGIVYRHGFKRPFTVAQEPRPIPPPVPPQPPPFPGPTPHPHPIPPAQPQSV